MKRSGFGLLCIVILGGCASGGPIGNLTAVERTRIADIDDATLAIDYAAERIYLQEREAPLKLGLALSGGGTKAAMFAHGVLNGLHNAGILQNVDVISTVSGGGYAAYWYFSKLLAADEHGFDAANIFDDCLPRYWTQGGTNDPKLVLAMHRAVHPEIRQEPNPHTLIMPVCETPSHLGQNGDPFRWQAHLVRWPDVFGTTPVSHDGSEQGRPEREIRQGLFDGLLVEPVTQMFKQGSNIPMLYQWGIERTWGLNPAPRKSGTETWAYTNADTNGDTGALHVDPAKVNWPALRSLHQNSAARNPARKVPLWIVNANSGGKTKDPTSNIQRLFEMTAFGSGAEQFGYVNNIERPPIYDLGTSVRASAGFADAQGLTSWSRYLLEFLSGALVGARWGVPADVITTSNDVVRLRLSDGGGAENLGLYSLLKRGVKDIIVVDAAQDVEGDMGDLCTIRAVLGSQVRMEFPTLGNLAAVCAGEKVYNLSDWKSPVVQGTVTWTRDGVDTRQSRIYLIKAAWHQRTMTDTYTYGRCGDVGYADCLLTVFYGHNSTVRIHGKNNKSGNMVFPQLLTAGSTANSSSYLFWGYRELGRSMARALAWNDVQKQLSNISKPCYQDAVDKRKGERPYDWDDPRVDEKCPGTPP